MLTEQTLKEQLKTIAANGYAVPEGTDAFQLARSMTSYLGVVDPELRDELIYTTFAHWIYRQKRFNADQLKALLAVCLDEAHLEHRLGEQDTDSVFTRSFSVLHVALILAVGRQDEIFSADELHEVKHALLNYFHVEKDLRGYVIGKGWAHAVAHTADALDELVQFPAVGVVDLQGILGFIRIKVGEQTVVYQHDEDERLTVAVLAAWRRGLLSEADIIAWVRSFAVLLIAEGEPVGMFRRYVNIKHFLRSLYFRARAANAAASTAAAPPVSEPIIDALVATLTQIQRF